MHFRAGQPAFRSSPLAFVEQDDLERPAGFDLRQFAESDSEARVLELLVERGFAEEALALLHLEPLAFAAHWPAGSPNGQGGQFMPSNGAGGAGGGKPRAKASQIRSLAARGFGRKSIVRRLGVQHAQVIGALKGQAGVAALAAGKQRQVEGLANLGKLAEIARARGAPAAPAPSVHPAAGGGAVAAPRAKASMIRSLDRKGVARGQIVKQLGVGHGQVAQALRAQNVARPVAAAHVSARVPAATPQTPAFMKNLPGGAGFNNNVPLPSVHAQGAAAGGGFLHPSSIRTEAGALTKLQAAGVDRVVAGVWADKWAGGKAAGVKAMAAKHGVPLKRVKEIVAAGPGEWHKHLPAAEAALGLEGSKPDPFIYRREAQVFQAIHRRPEHRAELVHRIQVKLDRGDIVENSAAAALGSKDNPWNLKIGEDKFIARNVAAGIPERRVRAALAQARENTAKQGQFEISPATTSELGHGTVTAAKPLGAGGHINAVYMGTLGGKKVIIKPAGEAYDAFGGRERIRDQITPGKDAERERAGYLVAKRLGVDAPIAEIRHDPKKGKLGIQEFKENDGEVANFGWTRLDRESLHDVAFLDSVIGNTDRHGQNALKAQGSDRIIPIDHGLAFPESQTRGQGNMQALQAVHNLGNALLASRHVAALHNMVASERAVRAELEPLVGKPAVDHVYRRVKEMLDGGTYLSPRRI